jgi:hypothetical protein
MNLWKMIVLLAALMLSAITASFSETLQGQVVRANGWPVPGCIVSLVSPVAGRSSPSVTDAYGRYFFSNVPLIPSPYYLEVYWGTEVLYRSTLMVQGAAVFQVVLP